MTLTDRLEELHATARSNRWMRYFTTFTRLALVAGFLPAGYVKIIGERFTDLHDKQPMGHYLEALYHTGYYYPFVGYAQILAALLLLIPRTVVLGTLIYLPIILNIGILSFAVRFEGSLLTAPMMIIACVYLLCWHYDRVNTFCHSLNRRRRHWCRVTIFLCGSLWARLPPFWLLDLQ